MNNKWASLLLVVVMVFAIGTAVYWLEDRFGSVVAITAVVAVFCVLCLMIGFQMAARHNQNIMELLTDFAQRDAMTDRFRQQTMAEGVKGVNLAQRAGLLEQQEELEEKRWQRKLLGGPTVSINSPSPAPRVIGAEFPPGAGHEQITEWE